MNLNKKIALTLLVISIIILSLIWFMVIAPGNRVFNQLETDYRYLLKSDFRSYLQQIENLLSASDTSTLDSLIAEIKNDTRVISFTVFDSNGMVLATSLPNLKGKQISDTIYKTATENVQEPIIVYADDQYDNTLIFIYSYSSHGNKECAGGIEAHLTATNLSQLRNLNQFRIPLLGVILIILLIVINYAIVGHLIIHRLKEFREQIRNLVEKKNIGAKLAVEGNDEIAECAMVTNQLIGTLEQLLRQAGSATEHSKTKNKILKESFLIMNLKIKEQGTKTDLIVSSLQGLSQSLQATNENITELGGSSEGASAFIFEMQAAIEEIVESIEKLSSYVEINSSSLNQVTSSTSSVNSSIDELSSAVTEIVASTSQMDYAIKQVDTSTKEAAQLSTNTMKSAETGSEYVSQTINSITSIKNSVEETSHSIDLLIEKTEAISKVLTVIKDITEQTNLLSLNASILAAQAGEYGRSFGVVATEIKNLADKTASSTKEIKSLINQIQLFSQNTRHAMDASVESINTGIQISSKAGYSLTEILQNIKNVVSIVQRISNATTEQSRGSKQITDAMEKVADMTMTISNATQELNKVSQDIAASTNEVKLLSNQIKTNASEQVKGSKEVLGTIEKIALLVNAINEGSGNQIANISKLNVLVFEILDLTKLFMLNSQTIDSTIVEWESEQSMLMQQVEGFIGRK